MKRALSFLLLAFLLAGPAREVNDAAPSPSAGSAAAGCGQPAPDGWTPCRNGAIPAGVKGQGKDRPGNFPLWVCRAEYAATWVGRQPGLHPGKIRPPFLGCHISYEGREAEVPEYDVLARPVAWEDHVDGQLPDDNIILYAGYEGPQDGGQELYVCRTHDTNRHGIQLGKIRTEFHACYYPYGGRELPAGTYSVATRIQSTTPRK